jgi:hypothetical protein
MASGSVGRKSLGKDAVTSKRWVRRHASRVTVRVANTCEKALETKVRQAGKRECREAECRD